MPSIGEIEDPEYAKLLRSARDAYLDDRHDDCVHVSVDVLIDLLQSDPDALEGTRLEAKNFRSGFPNLGVTLNGRGTPSLSASYDGRQFTMSEAIYYYEYVLEAVVLAQRKASDPTTSVRPNQP